MLANRDGIKPRCPVKRIWSWELCKTGHCRDNSQYLYIFETNRGKSFMVTPIGFYCARLIDAFTSSRACWATFETTAIGTTGFCVKHGKSFLGDS